MKEYLVFDQDILTHANRTVAEKFCQANGFHLLQIGLDTIPASSQSIFISANQQFILGLGEQAHRRGFFTKKSPSAEELQLILNQIKPQRKRSFNDSNSLGKTVFFDSGKTERKDEKQTLLNTKSDSSSCCIFQ